MRKYAFYGLLVLLSSGLISCLKNRDNDTCNLQEVKAEAPEAEVLSLEQYLEENSITAQKHPSGLYYIIETPGAGLVAEPCSIVAAIYTGKFTNGEIFDSSEGTPIAFRLGQVIAGWQMGLKLIQPGGKIKLFIPPSLGYGPADKVDMDGKVVIPGNSTLIFDVELVDVQ
ncbi:MAG: FKBP-type peptidyl-prolyl cis-trans isomerase [Chitinophagaceae bacterium]|nr:FKBP-type peptidyl-prolyl cis-trans isomerase [Chitinophagaceae bacterium]